MRFANTLDDLDAEIAAAFRLPTASVVCTDASGGTWEVRCVHGARCAVYLDAEGVEIMQVRLPSRPPRPR